MTRSLEPVTLPGAPAPGRIGQATAIEQSRAVAEVLAAVELARRFPRNEAAALRAIEQACQQKALAERAFFRFPRGGQTVTGETIHLARTLARCWGNTDYGIKELERDDQFGQSQMLGYAWDMETNTRVSNTFIVPHFRDKKDKEGNSRPERLVDLRDIYENNTNAASRRVRECIFSLLPTYVIEAAKATCHKTLRDGGGVPLPQRIKNVIAAFENLGVSVDQLERKVAMENGRWTDQIVANLAVIGRSIERNEVTVADEFPPAAVTLDEIAAVAPRSAPPQQAASAQPASGAAAGGGRGGRRSGAAAKPTADQRLAMAEAFAAAGIVDPAEQLAYTAELIGRDVASLDDLAADQVATVTAAARRFAEQNEPPAGDAS